MSKPARFNGRCRCGASVVAGQQVSFTQGKVTGCRACDADNHPETEPVKPLELRIKVQRVRFQKPDGSWTVLEVTLAGPLPAGDHPIQEGSFFSVVGERVFPADVRVGDVIDTFGAFEKDPKYGWRFRVQRAVPVVAGTDQALRAFLARFPQVGPARAEKILQQLGGREAVIDALEHDPLKLTVVNGITEERALAIAKAFNESSNLRDSAMFIAGLELGEALTAQLLDEYGPDAKTVLLEDPFQIMSLEGIGFKRADEVATRLKIERDDPRRLAAATLYMLKQVENDGHTFSTEADLIAM